MWAKPYTDEEIEFRRAFQQSPEGRARAAAAMATPAEVRWLATLDAARAEVEQYKSLADEWCDAHQEAIKQRDEARAEVDSWRESSDAGWAKFDECRDDLKAARAEVARLRELDEQRVELIRENMERDSEIARLRERVLVAESVVRAMIAWCPVDSEAVRDARKFLRNLAAADTNNEGPSPAQREAGPARPSGASQDAGQPGGGSSPSDQEGGDAESPNARAASGLEGSGERARPSPPASPSPSSASDSGAFAALRLACANEALRTEPRDGKAGLYRRIMAIKIPSDAAAAVLPDSEGGSAATDLPEQRGDTPGASANPAPPSASREAFTEWCYGRFVESWLDQYFPPDDWRSPFPLSTSLTDCWEAWQASRAALPTREEIACVIRERTWALHGSREIADAILALIGGNDATS